MRFLLLLVVATTALGQSGPRVQLSRSTQNLRGVSVVSREVAWASGTHGTYLRTTDAGLTWIPAQVADATTLDFRAVVAFSADEAFLMSAGPGEQSRIYHTADAGQHWQLQFTNNKPKGFFDSMIFWDPKHGVVLGDPIPDDASHLKFELLQTTDGQTWSQIPPAQLPDAIAGEGAFAASNSCLATLPEAQRPDAERPEASWKSGASAPRQPPDKNRASAPDPNPDRNLWFATGGKVARVFHSPDRGQTWQVFDTPVLHGPASAGIFSIAFRDPTHGVIAGGDYKHPNADGPNLAFTEDGGETWTLSDLKPQAYFSAVAYDRRVNASALRESNDGKKARIKPITPERIFIVGQDFVFDFTPPNNPHRINAKKKQGITFNAAAPYPEGGVLVVGPKGSIAMIP